MEERTYLIGIDIGTSATKTALFDTSGAVVASSSHGYPTSRPRQGYAEQDPDDWWTAAAAGVRDCMEKSGADPRSVAAIGVDGHSWSTVMLDRDGRPLCPSPIWQDSRADEICRRLAPEFGDSLFRISGNPLRPNYVTGKLLWFREKMPDVYRGAVAVLGTEGYLVFRLTGALSLCRSEGYGFHFYDIMKGRLDEEAARALGIRTDIVPPLFDGHETAGRLTRDAAEACGLCPGIPVAAGGVDSACTALGAGVTDPGQTQEQGGQSGGMSICTDRFAADPRLIFCAHVVPGRWLIQGGTTGGGGVIKWAASEFGRYEEEMSKTSGLSVPAMFDIEARDAAPGCGGLIFLPYMAGERTPVWDPYATGVFYGMDFRKTRADFIRALMEGVGYSLLHNLDTAAAAGARPTLLRSTGGAANSLFWTQMKSDMTGLPVSVPGSDNATNLGAAILAGTAAGVYSSPEAGAKAVVKEKRRHLPDPSVRPAYMKNYERYLEIYESLKGLMDRTAED